MFNTQALVKLKDRFLLPNGKMKCLSASELDSIDRTDLRLFCHTFARYGLVTSELISTLKEMIGERSAIEIGAGAGDFGYHLGIPMTDNKSQDWPEIKLYYNQIRQPTVQYGPDVEEIDALDAVKKYKPKVVFGSWITHWIDPNLPPPPGGGSIYGVKEAEILADVETYIMLGNMATHGSKRILHDPQRWPFEVFWFPYLRSRASDPGLDRLLVWGKMLR